MIAKYVQCLPDVVAATATAAYVAAALAAAAPPHCNQVSIVMCQIVAYKLG